MPGDKLETEGDRGACEEGWLEMAGEEFGLGSLSFLDPGDLGKSFRALALPSIKWGRLRIRRWVSG